MLDGSFRFILILSSSAWPPLTYLHTCSRNPQLLIIAFHKTGAVFFFPLPKKNNNTASAAATQRQQVTSHPAYVRTRRGTMATWASTARGDGLRRGWPTACFQTENKWAWRLSRSKTQITSWVAIRACSRQRQQRRAHSVMLSGLSEGSSVPLPVINDLSCLFWAHRTNKTD